MSRDDEGQVPAPPRGRATIKDVARDAGVSTAAVSKVLRDAYGVSPRMRERVMASVEELGYRPFVGARALRGSTQTIGVVLVDFQSQFQTQIMEGISETVGEGPFQEVLIPAGRSTARQTRAVEALLDRKVDGLVLVAPQMTTEWLEDLGRRVPVTVVARHGGAESFDTVVDDDYLGAALAVDHLAALGHRRIAHVAHPAEGQQPPHVLSQTARLDGYRRAMTIHGLQPRVEETSYTEAGGHVGAVALLADDAPPTAVFAGADIAALGVLRALEEAGLDVPGDVSVCGYDNTFLSGVGRVSLTTVDQSGEETGRVAARLLLERVAGRTEPVHHVIAPRLVVRATTTAPR